MAEVTVEQLAKVVGTPVDKLLEQLKEAGLKFSAAQFINFVLLVIMLLSLADRL